MASMSERVHDPVFSKPKALLSGVSGIEFVEFERVDECCGFGGTFAVTEEAVSAKMGYDKLAFMQKASPDCIVSSDMSCLMHLQGCARRQRQDIPFYHLAEILNGLSL
jgi:L-lactate dehydrogenase complex protein LldE